jgi:hypothetical protein
MVPWPKPKRRSTGSRLHQEMTIGARGKSQCCGCARCWPKARGAGVKCYSELLNRYRAQAVSVDLKGHIQWAESMP